MTCSPVAIIIIEGGTIITSTVPILFDHTTAILCIGPSRVHVVLAADPKPTIAWGAIRTAVGLGLGLRLLQEILHGPT